MVMIDTSAWIEFFNGGEPGIITKVDQALEREVVAVGDLIYCEIMQGLYNPRERQVIAEMLLALPRFEMVGFDIAQKSADNYRRLREHGITIRKTIDVMIATFCIEHGLALIHHDRDFDLLAPILGLETR